MDADADETTDREIESYLKKLKLAGIEIDRRRYRNIDLQPISSPESVPCSPDKAATISRRHQAALTREARRIAVKTAKLP
jgi:hypothetical protein